MGHKCKLGLSLFKSKESQDKMLLISYIQIAAWNNPSPSAQPCFNNLHFSLLEKTGPAPSCKPIPGSCFPQLKILPEILQKPNT
jgi:hypothetical protein